MKTKEQDFLSEYDKLDRAEQLKVCEDLQERVKQPDEIAGFPYDYDDSDDYCEDEQGRFSDDVVPCHLEHLPSSEALTRCCEEMWEPSIGGDERLRLKQQIFQMIVDYAVRLFFEYSGRDLEQWLQSLACLKFPRSIVTAAMQQIETTQGAMA